MVEPALNVTNLECSIPQHRLTEFSILLKTEKQEGCHSYKGKFGKYQNWNQHKAKKYTASMAYDINTNSHFVLIVKFDERYNEADIKNALIFLKLEVQLEYVEKFKMESATGDDYFAVFRDNTIPLAQFGYSRNFINEWLQNRLANVEDLVNELESKKNVKN